MDYLENKFNFIMPTELNIYYCGKRTNTYNHEYGPAVRDHFLLVFIKDGNGILSCNDRTYPLPQNHLLVMFPNTKIYYKVNGNAPWTILWIGVYGDLVLKYLNVLGISPKTPVYSVPNPTETEEVLAEIFKVSLNDDLSKKMYCISLVHKFFSLLSEKTDVHMKKSDYIKEAINFMQFHYEQKLSTADLAKKVNLEKSYFSKLFKKETGTSPTDWIINLRIKKACLLLKNTDLSIKEVAYSVGINDQLYFSRLFKKKTGVSPSRYI